MKKQFLVILLVFAVAFSCFAQAAAEKVAAYDEIVAEQEKYESSAASKRTSGTVSLSTDMLGGTGTTRPAVAGKSIVGAGCAPAVMAGYNILLEGGTAFDAALAIAGVQSIVEASATNILGGDAMIMVWSEAEQKATVINGTGWAPEKATIDFYLEQGGIPASGALSVQIPGAWAGWMTLLENYGTMSLEDILAPVIERAEGTYVETAMTNPIKYGSATTADETMRKMYTKEDGSAYEIGDVWSSDDLANTLKSLVEASKQGATNKEGYTFAKDYFYRGPIAEKIVAWSDANGGIMSLSDFTEFDAEITEPWSTTFRGYEVLVCPPNSQGPALLEALNILENFDLESYEHNSAEYIDLLVQALNIALNDRNYNWGDTRFVEPDMTVLSKEYAAEMAKYIDPEHAMTEIPSFDADKFEDYNTKGPDTTFMAVVDAEGNMCIVTHSINYYFGSGLMVDGLGFFMNDRIQNFSLDEEHQNCLAAHKRPMQTITPSIGLKDGEPAFFVGTPNANNQEQTKLQVLLNYIEFGYRPQEAVEHPRFTTGHAPAFGKDTYNPGALTLMNAFGTRQNAKLEEMGYKISYTANTGSLGFGIYENGMWTVGAAPTRNAYSVGL